jgi:hypothetical protein
VILTGSLTAADSWAACFGGSARLSTSPRDASQSRSAGDPTVKITCQGSMQQSPCYSSRTPSLMDGRLSVLLGGHGEAGLLDGAPHGLLLGKIRTDPAGVVPHHASRS